MCKQLLWSNECTPTKPCLLLSIRNSSMHWALYNKTLKHNSKHETGDIMTNVLCTTSQCPTLLSLRWKLVHSIHLNAAVVARGILGSYFWLSMYWSSLVSIECCPYLHYWGCCLCSMRDRSWILLIYVDEGNINIINMEIFLLRLSARYFLGFRRYSFLLYRSLSGC